MFPIITISNQVIYTYNVFWCIGFTVAIIFAFFYNRSGVVGKISLIDFSLISIIFVVSIISGSAIAGFLANLLGSGQSLIEILSNPVEQVEYYFGRVLFYGGMVAFILFIYLYCKIFKISYKKVFGIFLPSGCIFIVFLRLACFSAGCCYGIPSSVGYVFNNPNTHAPKGVMLFPTQLIEVFYGVIMFICSLLIGKRYGESKAYLSLPLVVFTYAILRFFLEFMRGDVSRNILFLSLSQWLSLLAVVYIAIWFIDYRKKEKQTEQNAK